MSIRARLASLQNLPLTLHHLSHLLAITREASDLPQAVAKPLSLARPVTASSAVAMAIPMAMTAVAQGIKKR